MDAGDIYLVDLNAEQRATVLVASIDRFHDLAERALVVPALPLETMADEMPWRVIVGTHVFTVDLMRTVTTDRLLHRVDRAPADAVLQVRRAIRAIT